MIQRRGGGGGVWKILITSNMVIYLLFMLSFSISLILFLSLSLPIFLYSIFSPCLFSLFNFWFLGSWFLGWFDEEDQRACCHEVVSICCGWGPKSQIEESKSLTGLWRATMGDFFCGFPWICNFFCGFH